MGGVPGDDMFRPAGEGPPERAHLDGVVTIGHVGDEALDPFACGGLVAVCVELPDGLFGMPGGGHLSAWMSGSQEAEEPRVGVFEAFVGLGEQAPDPIESGSPLRLRCPRVSFWTRPRHSSSLALAWRTTWILMGAGLDCSFDGKAM
jgi:hypothetical protein